MPSIRQILGAAVMGLGLTAALPAQPRLSERAHKFYSRQNPQTGLPDGIGDVDILDFALTLELLEAEFYRQGFAQFQDSDFAAIGLTELDIQNLKDIGTTEQAHVSTLLSAITSTGTQPVAPCKYKFGLTDVTSMVATAAILENVGVSAYLGAAPLIKSPDILTAAAQIVTVESRHQTFIRAASKVVAVPSPFDTPLGVRSVFTLAAGFIESCPDGSNLAITPFSAVTMDSPPADKAQIAGSQIKLTSDASSSAKFCGFSVGGAPGGTVFAPFTDGGCEVPKTIAGITYVHLTSEGPITGILTDEMIMAGPMVLQVT